MHCRRMTEEKRVFYADTGESAALRGFAFLRSGTSVRTSQTDFFLGSVSPTGNIPRNGLPRTGNAGMLDGKADRKASKLPESQRRRITGGRVFGLILGLIIRSLDVNGHTNAESCVRLWKRRKVENMASEGFDREHMSRRVSRMTGWQCSLKSIGGDSCDRVNRGSDQMSGEEPVYWEILGKTPLEGSGGVVCAEYKLDSCDVPSGEGWNAAISVQEVTDSEFRSSRETPSKEAQGLR